MSPRTIILAALLLVPLRIFTHATPMLSAYTLAVSDYCTKYNDKNCLSRLYNKALILLVLFISNYAYKYILVCLRVFKLYKN